MYRTAIVDELGHPMFWCDELAGKNQIECILNSHPEWSIMCTEVQKVRKFETAISKFGKADTYESVGNCIVQQSLQCKKCRRSREIIQRRN